ncbi:MAG TPA: RdgB/HAM1 family non-canonical purine NTP pyrophosphatase [Vicinamibacteria bacterium]|nr:RdgB/HAM1 family non-canonical purine NTP pyrophosphatase [Vicinamibacteria bacterium]
MKLLLATTSAGKLRELRAVLEGLEIDLVTLDEWPEIAPPAETGHTFLSNAAEKALYYHRATGIAALGEDSGLVVDALGGEPGVHSARWLGESTTYDVKNRRLLESLRAVPGEERTARYICAIALADDGQIVFECAESCEGRIATAPRGTGGFGYDPIFFFPPLGKCFAQMTAEEKNAVSHRGKAMARLSTFLRDRPR